MNAQQIKAKFLKAQVLLKGFKINIKNLLSESGAGVRMVLVKGVKMMEAIFEGEYADT